jgi:hypothetical protein
MIHSLRIVTAVPRPQRVEMSRRLEAQGAIRALPFTNDVGLIDVPTPPHRRTAWPAQT